MIAPVTAETPCNSLAGIAETRVTLLHIADSHMYNKSTCIVELRQTMRQRQNCMILYRLLALSR